MFSKKYNSAPEIDRQTPPDTYRSEATQQPRMPVPVPTAPEPRTPTREPRIIHQNVTFRSPLTDVKFNDLDLGQLNNRNTLSSITIAAPPTSNIDFLLS